MAEPEVDIDETLLAGHAATVWPGRRLGVLFALAVLVIVAAGQEQVRQYISYLTTLPPPRFGEWAHPDEVAFGFVSVRVFLVAIVGSLPMALALAFLAIRVGVPATAICTGVLAGIVAMGVLGAPVPQLVRAVIGMAGPDGRVSNPASYVVAPIAEEVIKLGTIAVVVALARPRAGIRQGLLIGASVGLGVTVLEAAGYTLSELVRRDDADWMFTMAIRFAVAGAGLHTTTAALTGAGVGAWRVRGLRSGRGALLLAGAVTLAMLTHGTWNRLAEDLVNGLIAPLGQVAAVPPVAFLAASTAAVPFLTVPWLVLALAWRRSRPGATTAAAGIATPSVVTPDRPGAA